MSNENKDNVYIKFGEVWSVLWDRLGSQRLLFITAMIIGMGEAIVMMIFPVITDIYFNQLELNNFDAITLLLIICTAAFFIITAISLLSEYLKQITTTKLNMNITLELADHAQRLPIERAQGSHSSDLVQRVTHDTKRVTWLLTLVIDKMGNQALIFILAAIYMFWLQWKIALVILIITPLIFLLSHLLRSYLRKIGLEVAEQEAIVRQYQQDTLQGMETIKAYGVGDWMLERFVHERERLNTLYLKRMWWQQAVHVGSATLTSLIVFTTLSVVGWLAIQGSLNLGALMAFFILIWRITSPLQSIASHWGEVQGILGSAVRTFSLWRIEKEPQSRLNREEAIIKPLVKDSSIRLEGITYAYLEDAAINEQDALNSSQEEIKLQSTENLLHHFTLHIASSSFTALVGPSGSGKSTIAKIAAGLLFPKEGKVLIGGCDSLEDAELARKDVAYVPQTPYLFSGSIRDNLLSVRPEASEEELFAATKKAQAHEFIMELPHGYDTNINEHGNSLSGGQKQRLAIARAIIANRAIWILDEATSALDLETERKVMAEILQTAREKKATLLVVAHRLSTVQAADQIIVMQNGIIKQQGKHEELLGKEEGLYLQLSRVV